MSKSEVLSAAARKKLFLSPEALEIIMSNSDPVAFTNTVLSSLTTNSMFVTKDDVMKCLEGEKKVIESPKTFTPHNRFTSDISVIEGTDVTSHSLCVGDVNDFFKYFQNRFVTLKKILEHRSDFGRTYRINECKEIMGDVRIVGIVNDKRFTGNGNLMLLIEDDGGDKDSLCRVIIKKDSEFFNDIYVNDEVLGFVGKFLSGRDDGPKNAVRGPKTFVADRVVKPGIPDNNRWVPSDTESQVAFLSDIHIGSYKFCKNPWNRMIEWLKENSEEKNINYIVMPGDVVDGIGIFPDQEKELVIKDIYEQYETLAESLKDIPDHIKMVIHPGNHDACRPAEPQPALNKVFTEAFDSNILMVGNPVYLNIEGRKVLTYHGRSIDDWVSSAQQLTYEDPLLVMKAMVNCRHLAPIYGLKTALAPEKKDFMVMGMVPDIFVSGHVHGYGFMNYRGVKMINASTWQDQTDFQKTHNFNPKPAVMPVIHLGTGKNTLVDFNHVPRE